MFNKEEKLPITEEPQYLELKSKVEELSAALSSQNQKTEEVEQLLQSERLKSESLHNQRTAVYTMKENSASESIDPCSKLDLLLNMRAENTLPCDPNEVDVWDIDSAVDNLSDLLVDKSSSSQVLQKQCVESIIDKSRAIKSKHRIPSITSTNTPLISAAGNAKRLLENSPRSRGRSITRGVRGSGSVSPVVSRSSSVKRSAQSNVNMESKIPKISTQLQI